MLPMNVDQVDKNLQAIKTLEGSWSLAPLPETVKLDLASQVSMSPETLSSLMNGINDDVRTAERRQPYPTRSFFQEPSSDEYTPQVNAGRALAGVLGLQPPEQIDVKAVQRWKQRAVDEGYLDLSPAEVASPSWLPEYRSIAREMTMDAMGRQFAGEEPGSISLDRMGDLVEKWLSPKGLYQAALNLDLWWDTDAITREFQSWGEKMNRVKAEPYNPAAWIDALTGPIDDIAFPILNWGLMLIGVGEVMGTGRALHLGAKTLRAVDGAVDASHVAGIYSGAKGAGFFSKAGSIVRAGDRTADIARLQQPGLIAGRLAKAENPVAQGLAKGMEAWRGNAAVTMARKTNQSVMRLGFVSNLQALTDEERGISIGSQSSIDDWLATEMDNPIVDWGVDLLFTPMSIFEPGSVKMVAKAAGRLPFAVVPKRLFAPVTENEKMVLAWERPTKAWLDDLGEQAPMTSAQFDEQVAKAGMTQALADVYTGGDVELLGSEMAWRTVMAAVDMESATIASTVASEATKGSTGWKNPFFRSRNALIAQLRRQDGYAVDEILHHWSLYGDPEGAMMGRVSQRGAKQESAYQQLREAYTLAEGETQEGMVRLYRYMDMDDPDVWRWTQDASRAGDDAQFVDVDVEEFAAAFGESTDSATRILATDGLDLDGRFVGRYMHEDANGVRRLRRVSEAGAHRQFDRTKLKRLRELADGHNAKRDAELKNLLNRVSPELMEQHLFESLQDLGHADSFWNLTEEIRGMAIGGRLGNARFVPAKSQAGHEISMFPKGSLDPKWSSQMFELAVEAGGDQKTVDLINRSIFSPLARDVRQYGPQFTVARKSTRVKQDAIEFAHRMDRQLENLKWFRSQRMRFDEAVGRAEDGEDLAEVLAEMVAAAPKGSAKKLRRLLKEANDAGVSVDQMEELFVRRMTEAANDQDWVLRWDIDGRVGRGGSIEDQLAAKVRELRGQSNYMASAIENIPTGLAQHLDDAGYKLVYGVNFAAPTDVSDLIPALADVQKAHVRSARLQRFASRQDDEYIRRLKARTTKSSLHAAISRAARQGGDIKMVLGSDPDGGDMHRLLSDLRDILEEEQTLALANRDALAFGRATEKIGARVALQRVPMSIDRMGSELGHRNLMEHLRKRGYNRDESNAIFKGLMQSMNVGFEQQGLVAIESYLRSKPLLTSGLRLLGKHDASGMFNKAKAGTFVTVGAVGGFAAGQWSYNRDHPDSGPIGGLAAGAVGALAGKAAGTLAARRIAGAVPELTKAGGAKAMARMADKWDSSRFAKWAYLGDNLAQVRDLARFSLSPIFDASRYSEAIMLNQIGKIPKGVNLKLNSSPRGFRSMLRKEFRDSGVDASRAEELARQEWDKVTKEFAAAAKGDFDWETLDDVGRRFSSVGILGFSPADWMASLFGHMRREGVDAELAYKTVREIHTYGTTGRSAAEMSMNFVFFPFSFTKKMVGHLGTHLGEDLGRTLILHDMMKTYELLNENYDLSTVWKERLPILDRMNRLNMLAYGVGLGQFGGVNANMMEALGTVPVFGSVATPGGPVIDPIMNLFVPQMVPIRNEAEAEDLWDSVRQALPVINDINGLIEDISKQNQVIFSEQHLTAQAQSEHAWGEWRDYQASLKPALQAAGLTWQEAVRKPEFAKLVGDQKAEISAKYPSWKFEFGDGIAHRVALDMELEERMSNPVGPGDRELAEFKAVFDVVDDHLAAGGRGFSDLEDVPPEAFEALRAKAGQLATREPAFVRLYNRFYRSLLGDLSTELR